MNGRQSLRQRLCARFAAGWSCLRLRIGRLIPPMGRQEIVEPLSRLGIDPAAEHAAARKCERVHTAAVDHGEFHVSIKWRGVYGFPLHDEYQSPRTDRSL